MIVLAGAGLMVRTYRELLRIDLGYDPHNVLTAQLALPGQPYSTVEKIAGFHRELLPRGGDSGSERCGGGHLSPDGGERY